MNNQTEELQIDIFDILRDILKDWWLILIIGLAAAMGSYIVANSLYRPSYTATATFVVTTNGENNTYTNLAAANKVASSLSNIFASDVMKKKVAIDIGSEEVPGVIRAEVIPETNLIVLRVSAPSPNSAFKVITSLMENYTSVTSHIFSSVILEVLEAPVIPSYPDNSIDTHKIMKMAFYIGMAAMAALLAFLSAMRDNVKNEKDVAKKLDSGLYGVIYHENKYKTLRAWLRKFKRSILITDPTVSFDFVENFKKIRTKLEYKATQNSFKVILITSVLENEGKSTVATNLAIALSQKSENVLFIDCDLKKPSIYKTLQINVEGKNEIGECIKENGDLKETLTYDDNSGLYLMIGSKHYENSADLLIKDSLKDFIKLSREVMDYIIIDSPPISASTDTEILAEIADASLLVVKQSTARVKDINDSVDILNGCKSELLGCIFNNVKSTVFGHRSYYGHKGYYKGYYGNSERKVSDRV